jgi:hypothetical protein
MEFAGESRMILEADLDRLRAAEPLSGVRLVQNDDPWLKLDRPLLVPDKSLHDWLFPTSNNSRGYAANAVVVDGTIAGVWQRQQRKVTIHPWRRLSRNLKAAIEQEALSFPIRSNAAATVAWEER